MDNFISWLLPHVCIVCMQYTNTQQDICAHCVLLLPFLNHACVKCGDYNLSLTLTTCSKCIAKNLQFDKFVAPFYYEPPIKRLIQTGKFKNRPYNLNILTRFLIKKIQSSYTKKTLPTLLLPVPMHYKNLKKRGFNQSIIIANTLSQHLNIPTISNLLIKKKLTAKQSALRLQKRLKNINNAFKLTRVLPETNIAIIDDVLTTGATINAIADLCKNNGATFIHAWCLART